MYRNCASNYCNCCDDFIAKRICCICENEYEFFLNKENVQAIGFGYKEINGVSTCEKCIKVFVKEKVSNNELPITELIPNVYDGIKTDIVESKVFSVCQLTKKVRPAPCGYSIGPAGFQVAGTLGCLAKNPTERAYYVLGTNHILSQLGKVKIGTAILQPSVLDGGKVSTDTIAHLTRAVPIGVKTWSKTPINYVDAAVARVTDTSLVSPKIALLNKNFKNIGVAMPGDRVFKVGRDTEITKGVVASVDVTIKVKYPEGEVLFQNQIITTVKAEKGDSGSILTTENLNPIGMLSANNVQGGLSMACDLKMVTSLLQIQIVTENDNIYR